MPSPCPWAAWGACGTTESPPLSERGATARWGCGSARAAGCNPFAWAGDRAVAAGGGTGVRDAACLAVTAYSAAPGFGLQAHSEAAAVRAASALAAVVAAAPAVAGVRLGHQHGQQQHRLRGAAQMEE
eukprot:scaffold265892_cov15-Tisochrysis_lutea.AAC.1